MPDFQPQQVPDPIFPPGQKPQLPSQNSGGRFSVKSFYSNNKWYVWAIVVGLVIIATLSFFAFRTQKASPTKPANVEVDITAPETAPSGGEVIYKIKVENHDAASLVDMDLEVLYPEGVSYVSSTPKAENLSGSSFQVPDLSNGQNATLIIKTIAQGNINDSKTLVAKLHYKFDNFNSEFVKEASHTVRLVASDVVLDVTGPDTADSAQVVSYDVFYRNNSSREIDNSRIQITYPEGFTFADSEPDPSLGQNIWNIGQLKASATGKISFQGAFKSAQPGQAATFKVEFLVLDDNGNFFTQGSTTYTTSISSQPLRVEQKLTSGGSNGVVKPGESLSYEIKYQNTTDVVASGTTIVAEFDSKAIDLSTIRSESGRVQDGTITWDASGVSTLERLGPNQSGTVRFTAQVKDPAAKDNSTNLTITSKVKIKANEYKDFMAGNDLTLKVSSPSSLKVSTAYSSGSLPPKAGTESKFTVTLELRNATNAYQEGVLVGFVPTGVSYDASMLPSDMASQVKFDASTGKLTWNVGKLEANTGSFSPLRKLTFGVRFTPSSAQVGQDVALFKNITFTAKDSFTEQSISLTADQISTNSLGDGSGRVVQ